MSILRDKAIDFYHPSMNQRLLDELPDDPDGPDALGRSSRDESQACSGSIANAPAGPGE